MADDRGQRSEMDADADVETVSVVSDVQSFVSDDLDQRFSRQQEMIRELREMMVAEETARSQKRIKIEKCASQLARIRDRAKTTKLNASPRQSEPAGTDAAKKSPDIADAVPRRDSRAAGVDATPSRNVTEMLHRQIKEHKAIIAERAKNEKELEDAVAKIQKQLEQTQTQAVQLRELGSSKPPKELLIQLDSNRQITELQNKVSELQATVADLQETCKEKDSIIEAKTKAITLMSADLSLKGKNTLDLLNDTKEQMQKMQLNFAQMEKEMSAENMLLKNRIQYLEEANTILENERFKLTMENTELEENLKNRNSKIDQLKLTTTENPESQKKVEHSDDVSRKMEIVENINRDLRHSNIELQEQLKQQQSPKKQGKQKKEVKTAKNIDNYEAIIANLNKQILEKEIQLNENQGTKSTIDLETKLSETEAKLSELNKSLIKTKAAHKTKVKQMQKCIDDFTKVSDANSEVVRLQNEVKVLSLKVAELEEDKGNLQLHLVDYDSGRVTDSQLHSKLMEIESVAEERLKAIADLETQKFDLVQDLHLAKITIGNLEDKVAELSYLESEHVTNEMNSVQMEEQLDKIKNNVKELEVELSAVVSEKEDLIKHNHILNSQKVEITNKLELYIQENMELSDKLEKLNAEKVSSAESIEMVEKTEVENYQQQFENQPELQEDAQMAIENQVLQTKTSQNLEEELQLLETERNNLRIEYNSLRSEHQILKEKITTERDDFNQKLKTLETDIQQLNEKLETVNADKNLEIQVLRENFEKSQIENDNLNAKLESQERNINTITADYEKLKQGFESLISEKHSLEEKNQNLQVSILEKNVLEEKNQHLNIRIRDLEASIMEKNTLEEKHQELQSNKVDNITQTEEEKTDKSKNVKNLTKEILRLKNQLKSQEHELQKLSEANENLKENSLTKFEECENLRREIELFKAESLEEMKCKDENIKDLTNEINQLEIACNKLKSSLSQYENEKCLSLQQNDQIKVLENNLQSLKNSNAQLEKTILDLNNELQEKQKSIQLLNDDLNNNNEHIKNLKDEINISSKQIQTITKEKEEVLLEMSKIKNEIKEKDEELHEIKLQLRKESIDFERIKIELEEKCQSYETTDNKYKEEIENLEKKCKEQLEKLKKYSVTLKKKTNLCTEMETKIADLTQSLQNSQQDNKSEEIQALREQLLEKESSVSSLESSLQNFLEVEKEIELKKCEIESLVEKLEFLQLSYNQYKSAQEAKLQEREMYVESLESELTIQKDKTWKLEETVSAIEEKRAALQNKNDNLITKLEEKHQEYFTHGDHLEKRLQSLVQHEEIIQKQLDDTKNENESLLSRLNDHEKTNKQLLNDMDILKSEITSHKKDLSEMHTLQEDRLADLEKILVLENELKRIHYENSEILKAKTLLESDLQSHLRDSEEQLNFVKEQRDKFYEELMLHMQKLKELENDFDILKTENEHLKRLYDTPKISSTTQTNSDNTEEKLNSLQTQFSMCLSQLSEAAESEKLYKEKCAEQERIIGELRNKPQDVQEFFQKKELKDVFATIPPAENMWQDLDDQIIVTENMENRQLLDQIIPTSDVPKNYTLTPDNERMIRSFDHDPPKSVDHFRQSSLPDEQIKPKKAYVCQEGLENEESLKIKNDKLTEELVLVKHKLGKSIKKLKEMKTKHDQLETEVKKLRMVSDFSLDFAIQDELSNQVKVLEDAIAELKKEQQKEKTEKETFAKRIDNLTTANEKLLEAKKQNDAQLELYEIQNRGLVEKIKNLEWNTSFTNDDDNITSEESELRLKINNLESEKEELRTLLSAAKLNPIENSDELRLKINNLESKNEELQRLLSAAEDSDELRLKINNLESEKKQLQTLSSAAENSDELKMKICKLESEKEEMQILLSAAENSDELRIKINNLESEKQELQTLLSTAKLTPAEDSHELRLKINNLESEKEQLQQLLGAAEDSDELRSLKTDFELVSKERDNLQTELKISNDNVSAELNLLKIENEDLRVNLEKLVKEYSDFQERFNNMALEKDKSELENASLLKEMEDLQMQYKQTEEQEKLCRSEVHKLAYENEELIEKYDALLQATKDLTKLQQENSALGEKVTQLTEENIKYKLHIEEMQENLALAINQRGEEIAELWKQHLEAREKEFEEAQKALYQQMNDGSELSELKIQLEELLNEKNKHEIELQESQQLREQLAKLEDAVHEKDVEMANLRLSFHSEKTNSETEIAGLREQLRELQSLAEEESQQLGQMRTALENQEIEIVTLKENLAVHTHAYDKLNEVYLQEKAKPKLEKHVSFAEDTKPGDESQPQAVSGSEEKPQKPDLDLALYMLYQRDMRCEELTVELVQLLEERDTLQLKLSNAIKTIEDLKPVEVQQTHVIEKSPVPDTADPTSSSLETKLSQLHRVGHGRDIRLRDEREERQKQMELLHRDLENLPPEAAAKLREAHYTLSRDTQSTSTVLLNWLWGKTTPKVVHM